MNINKYTFGIVVMALISFSFTSLILGQNIYWTDWINQKIQRSDLDGSNVEDLITTGLQTPWGSRPALFRGSPRTTSSRTKSHVLVNRARNLRWKAPSDMREM